MADVFSPPPTDKSVDLLGHILGTQVGSVYLGGAANPALMNIFQLFNAALMALATLIVSYTGIISTLNTAQEGQVMGRKWSSIWIPMRSILGMIVIVPTPASGYSVIQTIVMWCIMQGIGAADAVWNSVLQDLSSGLSPATAITRHVDTDPRTSRIYDSLELIGADSAESLLRSAVCMQTIFGMHSRTLPEPAGGFRTPKHSHVKDLGGKIDFYEVMQDKQNGTLKIGIPGDEQFSDVCGKYTISGATPSVYEYKSAALKLIFNELLPLAKVIVAEEVIPRDINNRVVASDEHAVQPGGFRNEAINIYRETLKYLVKPQKVNAVQDIVREGMETGWLSAGSFYFVLNRSHAVQFHEDILVPPVVTNIPSCDDAEQCSIYGPERTTALNPKLTSFLQYGPEISFMAIRLWDAKVYLDNDFTMISNKLLLKYRDAPEAKPIENLQANMLKLLNEMLSEQSTDPLIAQGKFGASIMTMSERSWLDIQNQLQTTINRAEQGYEPINSELMQKINDLSHRGSISMAVYSIVWIIGATLAIYVPLIPYMMFTVGVVGWLLLVVEAIVAAPVLAISFILPSGEELGKVVQGLLLLLNIVLRPVLMLFGFILAIRLYQAVVKLVNFGMLTNFSFLSTSDSMFAWVAILTIYGTFIIALSNKCFSLIYGLPDKILRWMGSAPEHTDAAHELHEAKSTMLKGADTVNKVSMGIPERNFARLQTRAKQLVPPDAVSGG
jgi:conjugal transfer/type IV secretion protein DotA/TraY